MARLIFLLVLGFVILLIALTLYAAMAKAVQIIQDSPEAHVNSTSMAKLSYILLIGLMLYAALTGAV